MAELRHDQRFTVDKDRLRVSWQDGQGRLCTTDARIINASESGLAIEVPQPLPPLAKVRLRSGQRHLEGNATVRYCRSSGARYRVGLHLDDILHWELEPAGAAAGGAKGQKL
jgi:PilZ domain-containing protein